jgi:hypothetical protein
MPLHGRHFVDASSSHHVGPGHDTERLQPGQHRVDKDKAPAAAGAIAKLPPVAQFHHVDHPEQLNVRVPVGLVRQDILQMDKVVVVQFDGADTSHARLSIVTS